MESVTIRLDKGLAKAMQKAMKDRYSTKTEFIREAIRKQISDAEKERALRRLEENFDKGKWHGTTDEDDRRAREEVSREYAKRHGIVLE